MTDVICCVCSHGNCEFDAATAPTDPGLDSWVGRRVVALQTHAEAQQEQIVHAEVVIQQLRAVAAIQTLRHLNSVTDGFVFLALAKMHRRHDRLFSAESVLAKPMSGLLDSYNTVDIWAVRGDP